MRCWFLILVAVLLLGCGQEAERAPGQKAALPAVRPPLFRGLVPEKPVRFDLAGEWTAFRYGTPERPGKKGPWQAHWSLRKVSENCWEDVNGQGKFSLVDEKIAANDIARHRRQILHWERSDGSHWWLSINQHSFGYFQEMSGADGEYYSAVRSD